jgi:hypothetical protein
LARELLKIVSEMKTNAIKYLRITILSIAMLAASVTMAMAGVQAEYQYNLSNFWGNVPSLWAQLAIDRSNNEIYTLDLNANLVRVFSGSGMELQDFGDDYGTVHPVSLAVGEGGDLFVLSTSYQGWDLFLCNYRGEIVSPIAVQGMPDNFGEFNPSRLSYQNGSLYLVDLHNMRVAVVGSTGHFVSGHDLGTIVRQEFSEQERKSGGKGGSALERLKKQMIDVEMGGFSVDAAGTMYFTVPTLFTACRLSTDGVLETFGAAGGGTGKFGVVSGIVPDQQGFIYLTDRLRCVVLIFDPSLNFKGEFGYRGGAPGNLVVPDDLQIDNRGNLYVAQAANRGISVFKISGLE